jgi:thiol-disulfide isomerase/thioredoxin
MLRILAPIVCLSFVPALNSQAEDPKPKNDTPATELLSSSLNKAKADGKAVFLSFGSPGCVWCKYLEKFHSCPAVTTLLNNHLVFVKVDIVDTPGGEELYKKYSSEIAGVPVWVILSADGKVLADSFDDKKKNVGFPYEPDEVTHYRKAIHAAIPKLTDKEIDELMVELKDAGPKKK